MQRRSAETVLHRGTCSSSRRLPSHARSGWLHRLLLRLLGGCSGALRLSWAFSTGADLPVVLDNSHTCCAAGHIADLALHQRSTLPALWQRAAALNCGHTGGWAKLLHLRLLWLSLHAARAVVLTRRELLWADACVVW